MLRRLSKIIRSFTKTEVVLFVTALGLTLVSGISFAVLRFDEKTESAPIAGGSYREGIIGQPTFINPILEGSNETDSDLTALLFANIEDLSSRITPSKDGLSWDVRLKEELYWHDGQPITADDVIFTIRTLQNPDTRAPLAPLVDGVEANRVSEREFSLRLPQGYSFFLNTIRKLRPAPKHIFGAIPAANLSLSDYNLEPVGNGPYKLSEVTKRRDGFITKIDLEQNEKYFGQKPYIESLTIKFYSKEDEALTALNTGGIDGISGIEASNLRNVTISHQILELRLPQSYAVFMNQEKNTLLQDKNIRLALNIGVSRNDLVKQILGGYAIPIYGPLVPTIEGYLPSQTLKENGDVAKANAILDAAGYGRGEDGIREKGPGGARLEFTLAVPDVPALLKAAELLRDQWKAIGIRIGIDRWSLDDMEDRVLKTRNYEMALMGQAIGQYPDLYPFWHSSQKFYPGLNLALYENKTADIFIEAIRKDTDPEARRHNLQSLQSVIENDLPAIFLYSPTYLYVARPPLQGFIHRDLETPSNRFDDIENWYVKTVRVFK